MEQGLESKLVGILDALSVKLGVATEYLWEILVRQQFIEACMYTGIVLIAIAAIWPGKRLMKYEPKSYNDAQEIVQAFGYTLLVVVAVGIPICIFQAAGRFVNPEFYALQSILGMIQ
jgi:hypothetical protein